MLKVTVLTLLMADCYLIPQTITLEECQIQEGLWGEYERLLLLRIPLAPAWQREDLKSFAVWAEGHRKTWDHLASMYSLEQADCMSEDDPPKLRKFMGEYAWSRQELPWFPDRLR